MDIVDTVSLLRKKLDYDNKKNGYRICHAESVVCHEFCLATDEHG